MPDSKTSCPNAVRDQQKLFSTKLHQHVLKTVEDVKNSFDKVLVKTKADEKYLLNEVNIYYNDLCDIVFQLQQVIIKIDNDLSVTKDLREVSNQVKNLASAAYETLNLKPEQLISKIKEDVVKTVAPVEALMKIVEHDDVRDFWQKILDIEHDLLISVEKLMLYNQMRYLDFPALESLVHTEIDNIKDLLIRIASDNDILEQDFIHYTSHSIQQLQKVLNDMRKSGQVEIKIPELSKLISNVQEHGSSYVTAIVNGVRGDQPLDKFIQSIEECHRHVSEGCKYVYELVELIESDKVDQGTTDLIHHLLVAAFVTCLSSLKLLDRSLNDAILYKS